MNQEIKLEIIFESTDLPSPCLAKKVGSERTLYNEEPAILFEIQPPLSQGTSFGNSIIPDDLLKYVVASAKHVGSSIVNWIEDPVRPFPIYASSLKNRAALDSKVIEHRFIEATEWASIRALNGLPT